MNNKILIFGAEENNLKQIDVEIPLHRITTIIGVSGSGKSSLIYKVIAEEAKRREKIDKGLAECRDYAIRPKFDKIENLPYCIVVKQRGLQQSHASTLATVTGLHELLRDEFVKDGKIICQCGTEVHPPTPSDIINFINKNFPTEIIELIAIVADEKYSDCEREIALLKAQYIEEVIILSSYDEKERIKKVKTLKHLNNQYANTIKINLGKFNTSASLQKAIDTYKSIAFDSFQIIVNHKSYHFKYDYICPSCTQLYHPITSNLLSFNSSSSTKTSGVCEICQGQGELQTLNYEQLIIPNKPLNEHFLNLEHNGNCYKYTSLCDDTLERFCKENKIETYKTFSELTKEHQTHLKQFIEEKLLKKNHITISKFVTKITCPTCHGSRLNTKANAVKWYGKNISELLSFSVEELFFFLKDKKLHHTKIHHILSVLIQATIGYLTLERSTDTLSGGELQRIKIAIQLNTNNKNLLYILDEPSIGLHAYDNLKFINLIKCLKQQGNTVIISEHNQHYIKNADYLIELGTGGGIKGGNVIFSDTANCYQLPSIEVNRKNHTIDLNNALYLENVCYHSIRNQNFIIPLNGLIAISGVSGSGKSSLIHHVLSPIIKQYLADKTINTQYVKSVKNFDKLQSLVELNQSQIGVNSRSIIATYMGFFDKIRKLFANTEIALLSNFSSTMFSFNEEEGQCEYCKGLGEVENNICPSCLGNRYQPQVLEVIYQSCSIADVLNLTIDESLLFFKDDEELVFYFNTLISLGLGHLTIGRATPTLSGGEGQRLKLAKSLIESKNKIKKGNFIYILDEPTTGLSYKDINKLFSIFEKILSYNNTIIVIEHNLTIIKHADYVIDMGLGAGKLGGNNLFSGIPTDLLKHPSSVTAKALQDTYDKDEIPLRDLELEVSSFNEQSDFAILGKQKTLHNCQNIYLTGKNFELEKQLLENYTLVLDNQNFNVFKSKEELFKSVSTIKEFQYYGFNPFVTNFFIYNRIAQSDLKQKLLNLSKIGFDALYISGEIYSIKNNLKNILLQNPWEFKIITNSSEQAYLYGQGWLSIIVSSNKIVELSTRLVSIKHKIIGSPQIIPATFNRYLNPCKECYGVGFLLGIENTKIIENADLSILDEGFLKKEIAEKLKGTMRLEIKPAIKKLREEGLFDFSKSFSQLNEEEKNIFLYGFIHKHFLKPMGQKNNKNDYIAWKGLYFYIRDNISKFDKTLSQDITIFEKTCPFCQGSGFNEELKFFHINNNALSCLLT
ncbi:Excinuclease ATPase subunit [Beggiatoa alba B18LD]|uniref:UvrABC system protein A n=2 Tax=Beggiatoa alba TaxID=1022 RepID=I3CIX2_9GAMM|nr:Excinuclease ATPase subunit [Beggiatoa alba B18LD]